MEGLLQLSSTALSLDQLVINLLLGIALTSFVAWFYIRYGQSLSNRTRFAQNLPALAVTTVLIFSVVQSSITLSLGLVGAFSIVRFRTAIKEPEELVYLFLSVAIGLGIGANQRMATILATVIILAYMLLRSLLSPRMQKSNMYFNLITDDSKASFAQINQVVKKHIGSAELRRVDNTADTLQTTYVLNMTTPEALVPLMDDLRATYPECELSFVEQDDMLTA